MGFQKGAIVDVYEEGKPTYRGCILEAENSAGQAYVCNLTTGRSQWQCNQTEIEPTTIKNIFEIE